MNETFRVLFGLLGGLAIFIYGMNKMSDCLQKAAGERMKSVLALLTRNPVMGVLAGAITTAVLQSSSATTVMAIGFVSAGLMSLPQAISIIFGANIGTTMTAQIIAFNLSDYIFLIIFVGFAITLIAKSQKIKNIGETVFGFGLLFLGIETMGDVMKPLASSPVFVDLIGKVADIPVLGLLLGTVMTLVVQSSSATIAVLQNFATQAGSDGVTSIIGLAGAIPILLGDNIGTTITAALASIGQKKDAKRAALAHTLFNLSGACLFIWFVKPYASFIQFISPKGPEVEVISRQIANAHTGFNITMTLVWIPLIWLMVKIVKFIIPEKEDKFIMNPNQPVFLDDKLVNQPTVALQLVAREILRCGGMVKEIISKMERAMTKEERNLLPLVVEDAETVTQLNEKINEYLATMFSEGAMVEKQGAQAAGIMYVLCDMDRIAMLSREICLNIKHVEKTSKKYSKDAMKDLRKAFGFIGDIYNDILAVLENGEELNEEKLQESKMKVVKLEHKLRKGHMERVEQGKCNAKLTGSFNALIHNLDRMGNSCINLSDMIKTSDSFSNLLTFEK